MKRWSMGLVLATLCTGCFESIPAKPAAQIAENASPSETATPSDAPSAEPGTSVAATPVASGEPSPMSTPEPAVEPKPKKGIIHQTTDEVVDAKEWLKKQGIEAKDGNIEGVDPFSQAASGYFTLAAKASTLGLQSQVQQYRALNDKFPTYAEFMQMMRDNRIEFAKLRWYEIYAYNEDTGKILVLVDKVAQEEGP